MTARPIDMVLRRLGNTRRGDRELLERFVTGRDEAAFTELVRRHAGMVQGVCRSVLRHCQDAEDACQATFLVLAKRAASIRDPDALAGWLHGVAYRIAAQARKQAARRRVCESRAASNEASAADDLSWREVQAVLHAELQRLPEKYRLPLILCCLEGRTRDEAARQLGWTFGTLKGMLDRGRELLRKRLERRGVTLTAALATITLTQETMGATCAAITQAALAFAAKQATEHTTIHAVALAEAALRSTVPLKSSLAALLLAGVVAVGAAGYTSSLRNDPSIQEQTPPPANAGSLKPNMDLFGDPLPPGAVARMGSTRFRHAGLSDFAFLDGGKTLLTVGNDRVLRFWETASGKQARTVELQGRNVPRRLATLSLDGKILAADCAGYIVLWETKSGKEMKALAGPKSGVDYLALSPDGKTLAVGRRDAQVSLWDWQNEKENSFRLPITREIFQGPDSSFHGSFSPDGKWFVAGASLLEPLGIFDAATGRELNRIACDARTSLVSPDSKRLAISSWKNDKGGRENIIRLFELPSGKETGQYSLGTEDWYFRLAFSPDSKKLACGMSNHSCVLDLTSGHVLYRLTGLPWHMMFSPDGKTLVASCFHRIRSWDALAGKELHLDQAEFGYKPVLAVSPNGRFLAAADRVSNQEVNLWDAASGRHLRRLSLVGEDRYVAQLTFSADGQTLVAGQSRGFFHFWDTASGKELRTIQLRAPGYSDNQDSIFFTFHMSPDTKHIETLEHVRQAKSTRWSSWEATTGKHLRQQIYSIQTNFGIWTGEGMIASLPSSDGLSLLDVRSGAVRLVAPRTAERGPLTASPDGRLLAVPLSTTKKNEFGEEWTGKFGDVIICESYTGKEVAKIVAGRVDHLALARDNRTLVTTDALSLHLWDLADGKELLHRPHPLLGSASFGEEHVTALALSGDGRRAFTTFSDGSCLVWDITSAKAGRSKPDEKMLAGWWADLANEDARRAYAAVWRLAETPEPIVAFLRGHLKPTEDVDLKQIRQFITDLDNDLFETREKAFKALRDLGDIAVPTLRQELNGQPSPEARRRLQTLVSQSTGIVTSPETLQTLRALQVLEAVASPEARQLIQKLAGGAPMARLTREAKAAVERLASRK